MSRSLKARLLAGGMWVLLGKVVTATCNLLSTVLLARLLTQELFGVWGLAFSLVTVGAIAAQLGLHLAAVRLIAESMGTERPGRARRAVGVVFRYCLVGNAAIAGVLLLGGGRRIAELWETPALALSLGGIGLWMVLNSLQVMTSEVFRGFQDLRMATLVGGVVTWLVTLSVLFGLWWIRGTITLDQAILVGVVATATNLVIGLSLLRRKLRTLGPPEALPTTQVFGIALPLWVSGMNAVVIGQVDLWILGSFLPEDQVAVYFAAVRLVTLVSMSLILINLIVPPFIAELYARRERRRLQRVLRHAATLAGIPAFAVLIAFVFLGEPILGMVFGEEYRWGARVLVLLSLGKLANVATGSCGMVLAMTGHQTALMLLNVGTSAVTVVAALWAVHSYGMIGVATVSACGTILLNGSMWLAARHFTGVWTHVGLVRPRELVQLYRSVS